MTAPASVLLKRLRNRADLLSTWRQLLAAVGKPSMKHARLKHGTAPGKTPRIEPWVVSSLTTWPNRRLPTPVEFYG